MTKPTLLQTILNRPSQSYAFPPEKYPSSKLQETSRVATNLGQSTSAFPSRSTLNNSEYYPSRRREHSAGFGVSQRSSTVRHFFLSSLYIPSDHTSHWKFSLYAVCYLCLILNLVCVFPDRIARPSKPHFLISRLSIYFFSNISGHIPCIHTFLATTTSTQGPTRSCF